MDTKCTYVTQVGSRLEIKSKIAKFSRLVHGYDELLELVYSSGHESRFNKDSFFSSKDFERLYHVGIGISILEPNEFVPFKY